MYVVGFLGIDGELGRTFICNTTEEYENIVRQMIMDNDDKTYDNPDMWDDTCTYHTPMGTYFVGHLETVS